MIQRMLSLVLQLLLMLLALLLLLLHLLLLLLLLLLHKLLLWLLLKGGRSLLMSAIRLGLLGCLLLVLSAHMRRLRPKLRLHDEVLSHG